MLFALLIFLRVYALRPPVLGIYYSIFFTGLLFNYSWQWVRQHYLINPLMPIPSAHLWDAVFTIGWAALFLLGYGLALILLHKLPNLVYRVLYSLQTAVVLIALIIFGLKYFALPTPAVAQASLNAEITRRPTDVKIVLIGIDGMWWKIMDPLLAEGKMPTFKKLIDEGASGPLETLFPTFSTTIWSSISTGKSPEQHHVTSFLIWKFPWSGYTLPLFRTPKITAELDWMRQDLIITAPATNQFLDATPIWYMLSDHGASVGTVNWWLSYPADSVNGFVVTDHCLYNKEYVMENFRSREGRTSGDIYPAGLLPELLPFSRSPQDLTRAEVERFIHIESDKFWDEFQAIDTYDYLDIAYEASMFKYSYPEDATFASATEHLIQTLQPDFLCVYLDGMDSMQHQYLKYYFASQHPDKLIPQNLERYRDLIINYYQYMDEVVGDFIAAADSNTIFMVISDHAFDETMMPTGHYNHTEMPPPGTPADSLKFIHPGVFICAGPGIKQGYHIADAQVYDITPTSLYLLGLPAAKDFDGMVLTEIMTAAAPVDSIATYEGMHHSTHQVLQTEKDQEIKEKLKALGYTQ